MRHKRMGRFSTGDAKGVVLNFRPLFQGSLVRSRERSERREYSWSYRVFLLRLLEASQTAQPAMRLTGVVGCRSPRTTAADFAPSARNVGPPRSRRRKNG